MTLAELRELPTTIDTGPNGNRAHESIFRSYQMLQKVRGYLIAGGQPIPYPVLLEMIDDVLDAPHVVKELQ